MAQTCRTLHQEIVDANTRTLKVSHFTVWCPPGTEEEGDEGAHPWYTIPHYLPNALNAIHIPSIRRIVMGFPFLKSGESFYSSVPTCFPVLATQLAHAHSLESLKLDMAGALSSFNSNDAAPVDTVIVVELFGRNLAKCDKLKDISFQVPYHCYCPVLVKDFMLAVTPTLKKRENDLHRIEFFIAQSPGDRDVENSIREQFRDVAVNFFRRVLCCTCLHRLAIYLAHSELLSSALLNAPLDENYLDGTYSNVGGSTKRQKLVPTYGNHKNMRHLSLELYGMYWGSHGESQQLKESNALLDHFSDCTKLNDFVLGFPPIIWNENLNRVTNLIKRNEKLSTLEFSFGRLKDNDGKMVDWLRGIVVDGEKCKISRLKIIRLFEVPGKRLYSLVQALQNAGGRIEECPIPDRLEENVCNSNTTTEKVEFIDTEEINLPELIDLNDFLMAHMRTTGQ
ncbi:hypothetical protein ACHAWF_001313 [Thalassiosira exigua]